MYEVKHNGKLPEHTTRLPLKKMLPGQSIFCPAHLWDRRKLANYVYSVQRRKSVRFTVKKVTGGFRVWRIA